MFVINAHKMLFIHIPKTGGSAITWALRKLIDVDHEHELPGDEDYNKSFQSFYHLNFLQHISYHMMHDLVMEKYPEYHKVAFIRNPWARVFSWYTAYHRNSIEHITKASFSASVRGICKGDLHAYAVPTQMSYICHSNGDMAMTFLGRFEHLEEDFTRLVKLTGITGYERLKDVNVSNKGTEEVQKLDYRQFYTETAKALVAEHFAEDIRRLNYTFEV